jgi:hypothetical protein
VIPGSSLHTPIPSTLSLSLNLKLYHTTLLTTLKVISDTILLTTLKVTLLYRCCNANHELFHCTGDAHNAEGDFRYNSSAPQTNHPALKGGQFEKVYLDTTYCEPKHLLCAVYSSHGMVFLPGVGEGRAVHFSP